MKTASMHNEPIRGNGGYIAVLCIVEEIDYVILAAMNVRRLRDSDTQDKRNTDSSSKTRRLSIVTFAWHLVAYNFGVEKRNDI